MRYHVLYRTPDDDVYGERELHLDGHEGYDVDVECVNVFTGDDLSQAGHVTVCDCHTGTTVYHRDKDHPTHVAIPVEQYVRIFGEL